MASKRGSMRSHGNLSTVRKLRGCVELLQERVLSRRQYRFNVGIMIYPRPQSESMGKEENPTLGPSSTKRKICGWRRPILHPPRLLVLEPLRHRFPALRWARELPLLALSSLTAWALREAVVGRQDGGALRVVRVLGRATALRRVATKAGRASSA